VPLVLPDGECSFCAYLSGERPYTILATGVLTAVLVTYEQRGIGHVLVIPRAHRPTLLELERDEASAVMAATVVAARAISDAFDPSGIAVWQNNGIPAHQSVPHLHVHVAGTLPDGARRRGRVPRLTVAQTDDIAAVLRPHLAAIP
jgi:histidine triad (HIT) family protein